MSDGGPLTTAEPMGPEELSGFLEQIERTVGLGAFVWEPGTGRVRWSEGFYRLLGLEPGPVESRVFFECVHPDDRARVLMAWRKAFEGGVYEPFEYRISCAGEPPRWVLAHTTLTHDGEGRMVRMIGTLVDVTAQHLAAERLAEANALLAETQRAAGVGTYQVDVATGRLSLSGEMYRLFGLELETPIDVERLDAVVHPEDRARAADYRRRIRAGEQPPPLLVRVVRPDGSIMHLETRARRAEGPEGPRSLGVSMDVTARVELEQQLRHAATMDAIGTLAAGMAHDFNNYLTVLALQVEAMRTGRRPAGPGELDQMAGAIERCAGLVRQLLAFARQHPFRPETLDLAARVAGVIELFRRLTGPEIEVEMIGEEPMFVDGDATQLDAALMNLLVNARDAISGGGRIRVALDVDGTFARVRISDSGAGIPSEVLPRIFEPYFTTKPEGRGVGLGLAAVYGTVRQHGGWIDVASEPGRGTTFELRMPLSGPAAAGHALETSAANAPLRVLLVEDLALVREAIAQLLRDEGHSVVAAGDGEDALARVLAGGELDVVLTDVVMPRMGGAALARALAEAAPGLPVILMSGHAGATLDGTVRLDKPFTREQLRGALLTAVRRRSSD